MATMPLNDLSLLAYKNKYKFMLHCDRALSFVKKKKNSSTYFKTGVNLHSIMSLVPTNYHLLSEIKTKVDKS